MTEFPNRPLKILVACEESQVVTAAFRARGHEAYSCDLLPTSGIHPEWHLQQDVVPLLKQDWDMVLSFPPCTDLSVSGARWFAEKRADGRQQASIDFFMLFTTLDHIPFTVIENPIGIMSTLYKKPTQVLQPWQFGHGETKATCLWLKGLPPLQPTDIVGGREQKVWKMPPGPDRARIRSRTYQGVADALAAQYSPDLSGGNLPG
jgi:site-specific DNA-cytosine methylase